MATDFIHRYTPATSSGATILLLHGTGGDEDDLMPIGKGLAPGAGLLSPRGQVSENGMNRFFRRLAVGVFDEEDVKRRAADMAAFVEQSATKYGFDSKRVIALGYSNGANIAAANLLLNPGMLSAAVLLRPQQPLVPETTPDLRGKPVLILAGTQDAIVAPSATQSLAKLLAGYGALVEVQWQETGHELTPDDFQAVRTFLAPLL